MGDCGRHGGGPYSLLAGRCELTALLFLFASVAKPIQSVAARRDWQCHTALHVLTATCSATPAIRSSFTALGCRLICEPWPSSQRCQSAMMGSLLVWNTRQISQCAFLILFVGRPGVGKPRRVEPRLELCEASWPLRGHRQARLRS